MTIIWGKKKIEKQLGFVADFCPICREIRPFEVFRVGIASHIYFLSFNDGELRGHIAKCKICKTKIPVDSLKYKTLSNSVGDNVKELEMQTYPNLRDDYAGRLNLEEKIQQHEILSPIEREVLLREPFKYLSSRVEEKYTKATFDKESGLGCFVTILLIVLFGCIAPTVMMRETSQNLAIIITGVVASLGLIFTVIQLMLVPRRFVQTEIIPLLAKSLEPLNPTNQEIEKILRQFNDRGFKIGLKISKEKLWEALQEGTTY